PHDIDDKFLANLEQELHGLWTKGQDSAEALGKNIAAVGTLPTISENELTLANMTSSQRYLALNDQVMSLRDERPIELWISGREDEIKMNRPDIMTEAAATSLQVHLLVDPKKSVRFYNACQIISAPMVALTANSPYLFKKGLWDETRLAVFEKSVELDCFTARDGTKITRVTYGADYLKDSLFELFQENLDKFPVLLPVLHKDDTNWLSHLRLHNGNVWRWNRPIIGLDDKARPHLRIEHRVNSAGPSIIDIVSNVALFLGLTHYYANLEMAPEKMLSFQDTRLNFYHCSKTGLETEVKWTDGKYWNVRELLLEKLIPQAKLGLESLGIGASAIKTYLEDVIQKRAESGQNGAAWQRSYIQKHGRDFEKMLLQYVENQKKGSPVHSWKI
ncbi:MAG: hypothetical protein HOM21_09335, partial [Halobacteriovoraceae bacterium]|nr:hypothetical protein [Halobacteriovoraceae bacterium]